MSRVKTTKNTVFEDLGFDKAESINLKVRADLMIAIRDYINTHHLNQQAAAELLHVDQPQISRLMQGKIGYFTIDKLLRMASRAKIKVTLEIAA